MLENVSINCHSSVKLSGTKTIYIDPFRIEKELNDADYIFCTHGHYDHFSEEDILKVMNLKTKLITVKDTYSMARALSFNDDRIIIVEPNNEYDVDGLSFSTVPAYNKEKSFHPKKEKWVGYIISFDGVSYYIAGDTDDLEELESIKCDVAFLPVGGTYTMDFKEAAHLANSITCDVVVPTHYGEIVGNKEDGNRFASIVKNKKVQVII